MMKNVPFKHQETVPADPERITFDSGEYIELPQEVTAKTVLLALTAHAWYKMRVRDFPRDSGGSVPGSGANGYLNDRVMHLTKEEMQMMPAAFVFVERVEAEPDIYFKQPDKEG